MSRFNTNYRHFLKFFRLIFRAEIILFNFSFFEYFNKNIEMTCKWTEYFFLSILWQQVNSASTGRRTRARGRHCRCRATTATRSSTWCAPITAASPSPSATSTVTPSGASTACRTDPCASSIQSAFTHSFTFSILIRCYANFLFF